MKTPTLVAVLAAAVASVATLVSPAGAVEPKQVRSIFEQVKPALVVVEYTYDGEIGRQEIRGAGIVVGEDGLTIASLGLTPPSVPDAHFTQFKLILPGDERTEVEATWLGRDERTGLTFIKPAEGAGTEIDWQPVVFTSEAVAVGDEVVSVGLLPESAGYKPYARTARVMAELRTPVPQVLTSEGLAGVGSPVMDATGRVIGYVQLQPEQTVLVSGRGDDLSRATNPPQLFIPSGELVLGLTDPPTAQEPVRIPHIGVSRMSGLEEDVAEFYGLENQAAVQVGDVIEGFPAAEAGIQSGDIIVALNGQPLRTGEAPEEAAAALGYDLRRFEVGEEVTFSVLRAPGEPPVELKVTLEERPKQANEAARYYAEDLGFSVRELVFEDIYDNQLPRETSGVVVAFVRPNSSAQAGELQPGDIITQLNQTPVTGLQQFEEAYKAFREASPREQVVMQVIRNVDTQIVRIEPPQE